ncbi:flagellar biosynthetic protein FliO [Eionea flava]
MKNSWKVTTALSLMWVLVIVFSPSALSQGESVTIDPLISSTTVDKTKSNHSTLTSKHPSTITPAAPTPELPNYGKNLAEMFLYLGLVVGLIFLLAWFVKKMGSNHFSSSQLMKVTACLPLSTKEKLMVVQIGEEQVVIGVAPGFVGHITSLKNPLVPTDSIDNGNTKETALGNDTFSKLLTRFQKGEAKS